MFRGSAFIAIADVRNMLRQRETLLWVFLMPVVFFYFIGTVTGGYGSRATAERPDPLTVVAAGDAGVVLDEIVGKLEQQKFAVTRVPVVPAPPPDRVLVVPSPPGSGGFTGAILRGERQTLSYRTHIEGPAVQAERVRIARAVYGVVADLAVLANEGTPVERAAFRAIESAPRSLTLSVRQAGRRATPPSGFEQAIPGTMVMFTMLVSLTTGAILLVIERRLGLLRRLAATPLSRSGIVAGKWMGRWVLAVVQIAFAMLTGTLLFRMQWGTALPMVFVLLLSWAAFNASLAIVLGSLARTESQMTGLGVLTSMAMGALGGCWWPIEIVPRWMQTLAACLPTGWAMDGLHRLVSFGDPPASVLPHVLALTTGACVLAWIGTRVFRFE